MKTLLILGHPNAEDSFCAAIADSFLKGGERAGKDMRVLKLAEMEFDPVLHKGYREIQELEPDLVKAQEDLLWADHYVFVYPNWWGVMPSLMKGFFDRVFLPGFAFKYRKDSPLWDKLLKGKTAHLLVTMDTPAWYYWLVFRRPGHNAMKRTILGFCGVKVKKITVFTPVKTSTAKKRGEWLEAAERLGSL